MELPAGSEPMALGSPTSPKTTPGAQFLPGFLLGELPAPATPQPRTFSLGSPLSESTNLQRAGGSSAPQPVITTLKDKSGAPPVHSIHDDLISAGTPQSSYKQLFPAMMSPLSARQASTPVVPQMCMSPAQVDPFFSQGESLSSEDQLDQTWVTVFGFPPAASSYILLQFAQYGNIVKHKMVSSGNWMHLKYQSRLQARKALSKDGKVFGDSIMVGVKPCIDKSVMNDSLSSSSPFSPSIPPSTPRSLMRPLTNSMRSSGSDYQVVENRQTPRKDDGFVSKAMEYMFGW